MPHPLAGHEILFTRQRHEAKRAGLHYDYRLVLGDKAYSWATKKDLPEPGKAIVLFEQPIHDRDYSLSQEVYIPDGEYGAGITKLEMVRKAKVDPETEEDKLVFSSGKDRFLLKKMEPARFGEKAWLFKNLTETRDLASEFKPDFTPDQMSQLGVLRHPGSQYGEGTDKDNFFGVSASLKTWPQNWHNEEYPQGWYQWYQGYASGKRGPDDERQIKRWISFRARHMAQLVKADPSLEDVSVQPKRRQALLNWGISVGDKNKYLVKIAAIQEKKESHAARNTAGVALGGVGTYHVAKSVPELGGYHTIYHGTHKDNVDSIIKEGLKPSHGGTNEKGAWKRHAPNAFQSEGFRRTSVGKVHVTKILSVAAKFRGIDGKILRARIPHAHWENMKADPHIASFNTNKNLGATTDFKIPAHQMAGNKGSFTQHFSKDKINSYLASESGKARFKTGLKRGLGGVGALVGAALLLHKGKKKENVE
jgi:hypothetical protein